MDKIIRIHEKILDYLIRLRKTDSELYFVPRKINNKERLEKGYWFLGNEFYLNLSFWNGEDWKEKIHNIGFVVFNDKNSYIELSAQDSPTKAKFIENVTEKLGGFIKDKNKNKWFRYYQGTNFLKNLNDFIFNTKPIIDKLIKTENHNEIKLLDQNFYNRYIKRIIAKREKQIEIGLMNKLSKVCWNTRNWKYPSGSNGKSASTEAFELDSGYGHEEWLFDKSKIVDGYHYAFLQPINIKTNKHNNKIYNISLFTINNLSKKYYIGEIRNVECINMNESIRVFNIYKENGWIEKMRKDVERVNANYERFDDTPPEIFFNIRFMFKDVFQPDELIEVSNNDINITTNRYKLLPKKSEIVFATDFEEDETEGNKKNINKIKRIFNIDSEYDPYHNQMQNAIFELLKSKKYNYKKVFIEKGWIDIKAKTQHNTWHFFELKTDNPKQSIRKALGQILEYAYFPNTEKAEKLIIISDEKPNKDVIKYLDHIRDKFKLPITYRHFNIETNELSDDY